MGERYRSIEIECSCGFPEDCKRSTAGSRFKDFLDYVKLVKQFYQTGEARLADWDIPKTDN